MLRGGFGPPFSSEGQDTTDGFREAAIRVPARAMPILFGGGSARDRLAEWSKLGPEMAGGVQNKCLRPALYALLEGGLDSEGIQTMQAYPQNDRPHQRPASCR